MFSIPVFPPPVQGNDGRAGALLALPVGGCYNGPMTENGSSGTPVFPNPAPLWTKDFTIITLGSVVSLLGNAVSSFAIGLLVLDYTDSILLYALFMVCYCLPCVLLPLLAGPYLDRFSRKRVIYTLDFLSSGIFLAFYFLLRFDFVTYPVFLLVAVLIGGIDSVYTVAYESFYPTLISRGNFQRAYSVSSLIDPLANVIMVPIAGICYKTIGLAPLFLFNAASFFIAAVMETQIRARESHTAQRRTEPFRFRRFASDLKAGLGYLRSETGLLTITAYFFLTTLCGSVSGTLVLPYFKSLGADGVWMYTFVMGAATAGRLIGGYLQYRFRYPVERKFAIAMFVYLALSVMEGVYLFLPFAGMLALNFLSGLFGVTSYNIRISSTQNYVPDDKRGRFNGIFQMLNVLGGVFGQLIAGAAGDFLPLRGLVAGAMAVNLASALVIMLPNREAVKRIYNVDI